jgi:protein TonB
MKSASFLLKTFFFLFCLTSFNSYSQNKEEEVLLFVEDVPSFPAGDEAMNDFLKKNIKYPELPKGVPKEGALLASFVVEKNGTLTDVKVVKGMSEELNKEIVRVIKIMPPWIPGMQSGRRVRVEQHLTIKFSPKGKLIIAQ